ncbi:MAG: acetylxylan esterase [Bryobacter sp.]|nr:acetylxylan esterase [Bryobacter sp.]
MTRCWLVFLPFCLLAQDATLLARIEAQAKTQRAARRAEIAQIQTVAQAQARQRTVREKVLRLMGGLPDYRGPLRAQTTRRFAFEGITIENVRFESLPGYWVTANLYLPRESGKRPAVLFSIGHWSEGKLAGAKICTQLARKGFVCLAYDPVGQGERQQAYDARLGRSLIGGATEQHFMAGAQALLLGQSVARYFIHDARRAIDYLLTRPEVDPARLGASGCSGGGTQTTYIAALDARIRVAAPACYMNSFEYLITGPTGDSEQSLPGFLAEGLDQADYVALFAPKPWLIASTEQDFFTPAGAKVVYDEARQFYRIFDREALVQWVVGPGGHGTPLKVREAIYDWMIRHLADGKGEAKEEDLPLPAERDLWVMPNGQIFGKDLTDLLAEQAFAPKTPKLADPVLPAPSGLATVEKLGPEASRELLIIPHADAASANRARELAQLGQHVLLVKLPGYPLPPNQGRLSGDWITHTRAWLVGWNLPSMRAADLLAVIRQNLPLYDRVYLHAWGIGGIPALLAAAQEPRLAALWLERTPRSLADAFRTPVHKNLHEAVLPGWQRRHELFEYQHARTFWVDPTDWNENLLKNPNEKSYPDYYLRPFEQPTSELLAAWRKFLATSGARSTGGNEE